MSAFSRSWKYFVALLLIAGPVLAGQNQANQQKSAEKAAAPPPYFIPPDAAKAENPVKSSPESLARAKRYWDMDCAMCHGDDGTGKTDLARDMKLTLEDFTDPATLKGRTDGELFYIIKTGKGQMPSEGDRAKTNDMWDLVNYVRSLAKKPAAEAKK